MLVSPQHFQQQDLYHESLLDARVMATNPYSWGVLKVEFDPSSLAAGQVGISELNAILPGGMLLAIGPGQGDCPPPRPLTDTVKMLSTVSVYVGVLREREGIANISDIGDASNSTVRSRYLAQPRTMSDLSTGRERQVQVSFAQPQVAILFDGEVNESYDSIKVAEIARTETKQLIVSQAYVPPCLRIGAAPAITVGISRIMGLMTVRQNALLETCHERANAALEFRATDITSYLQLAAINGMMPVLTHLARASETPPLQAYLLLLQFLGQLGTFSRDGIHVPPAFSYNDLTATFSELVERISDLLRGAVVRRFVRIDLTFFKNGVLAGELADDKLLTCETFVLVAKPLKPTVAVDKLAANLPKLSKVASKNNIKTIVQAASNGVPLRPTQRPPSELPAREGCAYFMLDTTHEQWRPIVQEGSIALFMPSPFDPSEVSYELLAIPNYEAG